MFDPATLSSLAGGLLGGGKTEVTQSNTSTTNVGTSIQLSNMSSGGQGQSPSNSASGSSSATPSGSGGGFPSVFLLAQRMITAWYRPPLATPDAVGISPMSSIPSHIYALGAAALGGMVYLMTRKKKGRK